LPDWIQVRTKKRKEKERRERERREKEEREREEGERGERETFWMASEREVFREMMRVCMDDSKDFARTSNTKVLCSERELVTLSLLLPLLALLLGDTLLCCVFSWSFACLSPTTTIMSNAIISPLPLILASFFSLILIAKQSHTECDVTWDNRFVPSCWRSNRRENPSTNP
jgi:hypothetical protein